MGVYLKKINSDHLKMESHQPQHLLTCSGSDPCVLRRHYYISKLVGTHVSDNTHLLTQLLL